MGALRAHVRRRFFTPGCSRAISRHGRHGPLLASMTAPERRVNNSAIRGWGTGVALAAAAMVLQGCGGGNKDSGGTGQLRFINATSSHPSLALMSSDAAFIGATALDAASAYAGITAGATSLQVTDAGSSTALATTAPTVGKDQHNVLLAYESNGVVKTWFFAEEDAAPATSTANLRVFDAAPDAGALDVFITAPGADLASAAVTLTTTTGTAGAPTLAAYSAFATPGTYEVRVTASGNKDDVRLDIPSITLADQQVATLALTPTRGGVLVNGGVILQQGAYTATRNPNVRVRLAAGVPGGVPVTASVGAVPLTSNATSPSVGTYVSVPVAGATLSAAFGSPGVPASVPAASFLAGQDVTLLATGTAGAATVTVLIDDNHLPTSSTTAKMRLVNGLSVAGGTAPAATLIADFNVLAGNIPALGASAYGLVTASATMQIDVMPPTTTTPLFTGVNVPGGSVYTMFLLGDASAPVPVFRRDR